MRNGYRPLIDVVFIFLCLFVSLIPVRSLQAPKWDVEVVDKSGNPASGVSVRESYQNYSAELTGHEETEVTDVNGHVHFDAKILRASPLKRFVAVIHSAIGGVQASVRMPSCLLLAVKWKGIGWITMVTLATGQDRHRL
jgi:hypothetical protein